MGVKLSTPVSQGDNLATWETETMQRTNHLENQRAARGGFQAVVDLYKKDVDRTLLRENLKLTVDQRFRKFKRTMLLFGFPRGICGLYSRRWGSAPDPGIFRFFLEARVERECK